MRVIILFIAFLVAADSFAQGRIAGRVTDAKTGAPLTGVSVHVKNSASGAVTDLGGKYSIELAPGIYVLLIRYLGYEDKEENVRVEDSQVTTLDVSLAEGGKALNEVVVRASMKKESVNTLYLLQRSNIALSSGISADMIRRSPDRSTGEALKRVSGASIRDNRFVIVRGLSDRYNAAMINNAPMPGTEPDKKAFSFDIIPAAMVDNIVINKTASADMPGDFAGGVVQVMTRDIPDQSFMELGLGLGYNTQSTFRNFISNGRDNGDYLAFPGGNSKLPAVFGEDYRAFKALPPAQRLEAARQLGSNHGAYHVRALPNSSLQFATGRVIKAGHEGKLGAVAAVTWRNTQAILPDFVRGLYESDRISRYSTETQYRFGSTLSGLLNLSYVRGKTRLSFRNMYNKLYDHTYYQREGYTTSNNQEFRLHSSIPHERQILSSQLEGHHAFGKRDAGWYWNLSHTLLEAQQHDYRTVFYSRTISFDEQDKPLQSDAPFILTDRNTRRFFSDMRDRHLGGSVHVKVPFLIGNEKQTLKAGYLGTYKHRDFNARFFQYRPYDNARFDEDIAFQSPETILNPSNIGETGYDLEDITLPTDRYQVSSMVHAAFLMFDNRLLEKLRISWGLRFESYTQEINTRDLSGSDFIKTDIFNDYLPSLNISWELNEKTQLRLSGSRTVNRPEFRELALFNFIDFENNWTIIGNPALHRGRINNVDIRYEYYPGAGELLSAGVFYKYFERPIENQMDAQANLDLLIFGFQNAKAARSLGAEVEVRKRLGFISEEARWLQDLIFGGNFTYIRSKVDLSNIAVPGKQLQDRPLQGQSPYLLNLSLMYNHPSTGLGFSMLYNRMGHRIFIVGNGSIPDTWENGRDIVDLQLSKSLWNKKAEFKLTIADLLSQPVIYYWNMDGNTSWNAGRSIAGKGDDQVFQKYRPGTTVTVGFNYRF